MTGATRYAILVAACTAFLFTALYAQASFERQAMIDNKWGDYASAKAGAEDSWTWFKELLDDARWDEGDETCLDHRDDMESFLGDPDILGTGANMFWAEDQLSGDPRDGQTISASDGNFTHWFVVFQRRSRTDDEMLNLLLHEGWHWVHEETEEGTAALKAEACAWIPLEEEKPECGAGADCNGGGETPKPKKVCTEQQVYVRWTVWVSKWEVIGFEWAKAYDPLAGDGETREQALELVPIYRTWFEQEQRGEWRTETVCTTVSS